MSWWGFCPSPQDFKAFQGGQFHLRVAGELELVQQRANIEVPPQGSHIFSPLICLLKKAYSAIV